MLIALVISPTIRLNGTVSVEPEPPAKPPSEAPAQKARKASRGGCLVICILILGGFIFVEFLGQTVTDRDGRRLRVKAVSKGLEIAIKGYKTEYLRLPYPGESLPTEDNGAFDTTEPEGRALLDVLLDNSSSNQNLRHIHFWEPPNAKTSGAGFSATDGLKDSWGKRAYKIILDYSGDGKIVNPAKTSGVEGEPDEITSDVIIYSAGPDGDFATWKDNVCSWR